VVAVIKAPLSPVLEKRKVRTLVNEGDDVGVDLPAGVDESGPVLSEEESLSLFVGSFAIGVAGVVKDICLRPGEGMIVDGTSNLSGQVEEPKGRAVWPQPCFQADWMSLRQRDVLDRHMSMQLFTTYPSNGKMTIAIPNGLSVG
jgi:hypothetical protein